jgi:hypothetical protein
MGDAMAESRGGNEDTRLKETFARLLAQGTEYLAPERFQEVLTSKQLKISPKSRNVCGLQVADLLAHPSRNEMLREQGLLRKGPAPFAERIIALLQGKYYRDRGRVFGKKLL